MYRKFGRDVVGSPVGAPKWLRPIGFERFSQQFSHKTIIILLCHDSRWRFDSGNAW